MFFKRECREIVDSQLSLSINQRKTGKLIFEYVLDFAKKIPTKSLKISTPGLAGHH